MAELLCEGRRKKPYISQKEWRYIDAYLQYQHDSNWVEWDEGLIDIEYQTVSVDVTDTNTESSTDEE